MKPSSAHARFVFNIREMPYREKSNAFAKRTSARAERQAVKRELDRLSREDLDDQADIAAEVIERPEFSEGYWDGDYLPLEALARRVFSSTGESSSRVRNARDVRGLDRLMRSGTSAVY